MQKDQALRLFKRDRVSGLKMLLLCVTCIGLMLGDSRGILAPLHIGLSQLLYPLQQVALWPKALHGSVAQWFRKAQEAEQQLVMLQHRSLALTQANMKAVQMAEENAQLRRLLNIKQAVNAPTIAAQILYTPANPLRQTLVLSKGEQDGIRSGMPVMGEGGLVGQVVSATAKTARVALITDNRMAVPAIVMRNGFRVVVFGAGNSSLLEVRYLSPGADIQEGDELVSSGIGGVYPSGLAIGRILRVDKHAPEGFVVAYVKPAAHPERHLHFLVLQQESS